MFGMIKFEGDWINDDQITRDVWEARDGRLLGSETVVSRRYVAWKGYTYSSSTDTAAFGHWNEARAWKDELHQRTDILRAQARMAGCAYVVPLAERVA